MPCPYRPLRCQLPANISLGAVVCYSFMGAMTFFFHCKPMAGSWDISLKPSCYSMKLFVTFGLVNTSFNIATDVLFAIFPIFVIWPLNMKRRLRIYLICILSLGYMYVMPFPSCLIIDEEPQADGYLLTLAPSRWAWQRLYTRRASSRSSTGPFARASPSGACKLPSFHSCHGPLLTTKQP